MPRGGTSVPLYRKKSLSPVFVRLIPFAVFIAFIAAQPLMEAMVDARWLVVARGLVVGGLLAWLWPRYAELRAPRLDARTTLLSIGTGFAIFLCWISFTAGWANLGDPSPGFVPLRSDGSLDPVLVAGRLAGMVLVVPVMEELFWRSFLMRWIDKRNFLALDPAKASGAAMVVTAALFAVEHTQWLAGLLAGVAYAALYVKTRNLWAAILSHAATNTTLGVWILATGHWQYW